MSDLYPLIGALLLCILAIPLGNTAAMNWQMPRPLLVSHVGRHTLPFSFEQVVSYFDNAFEKPGHTTRSNVREYIESNAFDEYTAIVVSGTEQKIRVTLVTNGDWGVNYIREFFEAPFFLPSESKGLYTLLDANPSARYTNLGRFDVQIKVLETRQRIVITTEFGASGSYQPDHAL
jgi:hypothetical protein